MTAQCGVQPMCGWQRRLCRGVPDVFFCLRKFLWKYSPFWCDLLLYKLQKLTWIPNIRTACGDWAGAHIHQELSRKLGDLPTWFGAPGPARSLSHCLRCIATTNDLSLMWVCNQGNGTLGHWWCWLSCLTRGFSCLQWYYGNSYLWLNHMIPPRSVWLGIGSVCFALEVGAETFLPLMFVLPMPSCLNMGIECKYLNICFPALGFGASIEKIRLCSWWGHSIQ